MNVYKNFAAKTANLDTKANFGGLLKASKGALACRWSGRASPWDGSWFPEVKLGASTFGCALGTTVGRWHVMLLQHASGIMYEIKKSTRWLQSRA